MSQQVSFMAETPRQGEAMSALTPEQIQLFIQNVVDNGAEHDDGCPSDDTCECSEKPLRDATNAVCHAIETELPSLRAQLTAREQEKDAEKRFNGKLVSELRGDEWTEYYISDEYDAVLPVHLDSRNGEFYVIDSDDAIVAGPMQQGCATRVMHNINRVTPSQPPQTTETK